MKRSGILRRTPLSRGGSAAPTIPAEPPAKRSTLRPVSKKRQAVNAHRAKVVAHIREFQDWCSRCLQTGIGLDAHELRSRGQGGSLIDPENIILLCRGCHSYVTTHPREAAEQGWAISRKWERKTDFWDGHERPELPACVDTDTPGIAEDSDRLNGRGPEVRQHQPGHLPARSDQNGRR